jgi:hypothetical protein
VAMAPIAPASRAVSHSTIAPVVTASSYSVSRSRCTERRRHVPLEPEDDSVLALIANRLNRPAPRPARGSGSPAVREIYRD